MVHQDFSRSQLGVQLLDSALLCVRPKCWSLRVEIGSRGNHGSTHATVRAKAGNQTVGTSGMVACSARSSSSMRARIAKLQIRGRYDCL